MARLCLLVCVVFGHAGVAWGQPHVDFELATERGFPLTGSRQWSELFRRFERTSVRIRGARPGDTPRVEVHGRSDSPSYHVLGILTDRNRLALPSSRPFTFDDAAGIQRWIERLRDDGVAGLSAERGVFGLTKAELLDFHDKVKKPVAFSTREVRVGDVARQVVRNLQVDFTVSQSARRAFADSDRVTDELRGLSSGTALAAALRPLGLGAAPRKQGGQVELLIAQAEEMEDAWPVGWPPEQSPFKTAPELFAYLNFEIEQVPLRRALHALDDRLELPLLIDQNAVARLGVDFDQRLVSFPEKRTFYKKVLDTVLFQAHLRSEVRVDEAGRPFLWITSTRD